jgi:hypothetical protein
LENGGSSLGDLDVKKLQILDFTKEADKDWVEVYSQESFRGNRSFLSNEKVLIKLSLSAFLNTLLPLLDLKILEFTKIFAKRCI